MAKEDFRRLTPDFELWAPNQWGPKDIDKRVELFPASPDDVHLMGTDVMGRDILAIILYGLRIAYVYSFIICLITLVIGVLIGGFCGYYGGIADLLSQRMVEILSLIPSFFLILIALSMFNPNVILLITINSLLGWIAISQVMRIETLKIRKFSFVESATALGEKKLFIFLRHIFPHAVIPVITMLPFMFMGHIIGLAVLDYLGLGIASEYPSIGALISQGQNQMNSFWWIIFYPSVVLTLILLGWVYVGESLRERTH